MQAKHTPGPWTWQSWNDGIALCADGRRIMGAFEPEHSKRDYPNDANAALIAAAPELLEALQSLQKELRSAMRFDVKKHFSLMVADAAANKAIAKATGD